MEEEESGQPQRLDDSQLVLKAGGRLPAHARGRARVSLRKAGVAELREPAHRFLVFGAGIPVAEVAAQIEPQALAQPDRLRHRLGVLGKARRHGLRRGEHVAEVAAALRL